MSINPTNLPKDLENAGFTCSLSSSWPCSGDSGDTEVRGAGFSLSAQNRTVRPRGKYRQKVSAPAIQQVWFGVEHVSQMIPTWSPEHGDCCLWTGNHWGGCSTAFVHQESLLLDLCATRDLHPSYSGSSGLRSSLRLTKVAGSVWPTWHSASTRAAERHSRSPRRIGSGCRGWSGPGHAARRWACWAI